MSVLSRLFYNNDCPCLQFTTCLTLFWNKHCLQEKAFSTMISLMFIYTCINLEWKVLPWMLELTACHLKNLSMFQKSLEKMIGYDQ